MNHWEEDHWKFRHVQTRSEEDHWRFRHVQMNGYLELRIRWLSIVENVHIAWGWCFYFKNGSSQKVSESCHKVQHSLRHWQWVIIRSTKQDWLYRKVGILVCFQPIHAVASCKLWKWTKMTCKILRIESREVLVKIYSSWTASRENPHLYIDPFRGSRR